MSGIWRKEQEQGDGAPIEYSQDMLEAAERGLAVQEGRWEQMFQDLRIEPLRLWYEDVVARPAEATQQVAAYLGVAIEPAAAVQVPPILKQSEGGTPSWIEKYAQSKGAASSSDT